MKLWDKLFLGAFLFWSAAGLIFTIGQISPASVMHGSLPGWLKDFIIGCLQSGDPILILLVFANTHLHAARQWGPAPARRWALIVFVVALAVETLGVATGFPFGAYRYTDQFGPRLGLVPLTIPLAWHVVVTNALFLARFFAGRRSVVAALTGLACTAYDFVLEPFATRAKHYWLWQGGTVPLQNYAAWFVISTALVLCCEPSARPRSPGDLRPALVLAITLLIFLAGAWPR